MKSRFPKLTIFPTIPFQVRLDDDMDALVQSVKERGIITPVTLRQKEDGRYEIVSGIAAKRLASLQGLKPSNRRSRS